MIAADGESISKIKYGNGTDSAEVEVVTTRKVARVLPKFSKEKYKEFELIDFR